jgi:hypothetical protein
LNHSSGSHRDPTNAAAKQMTNETTKLTIEFIVNSLSGCARSGTSSAEADGYWARNQQSGFAARRILSDAGA